MTYKLCLAIILAATLTCSCGRKRAAAARSGASSQNAVDSVVQPQTDMREKTNRSQESPSKMDETETEDKGAVANDNSA